VAAARRALAALAADDPLPLTTALPGTEQWRVLHAWHEQATFFDIETSGLEPESAVTLVVCLHRGRLLRFLKDENLDDFLPLLDEVKLLVSFNGSGFDVPRIESRFHVPRIPCAHLDLRWACHHCGWRGGLKNIERALGLVRPPDLRGLGGAEAVWLWRQWEETRRPAARRLLERYCAADVLSLRWLAAIVLAERRCAVTLPASEALWEVVQTALPPLQETIASAPPPAATTAALADVLAALPATETRLEKQRRLRQLWRASRGVGF
jgi:uncharacterized protein YprB with RNaseH-like and TPR domain